MIYMGSKSRIAKYIIPIISSEMKYHNLTTYVEPFVGGANVIDKIHAECRIGCDKNKYLIALYQNLDKISTLPDLVTKEHYSDVRDCYNRNLDTFEEWYIGAIGILVSYHGNFLEGIADIIN